MEISFKGNINSNALTLSSSFDLMIVNTFISTSFALIIIMQQGKQPKQKEPREIVGIGRNKKRVDLSKEFEEFKQRIQEFENKN